MIDVGQVTYWYIQMVMTLLRYLFYGINKLCSFITVLFLYHFWSHFVIFNYVLQQIHIKKSEMSNNYILFTVLNIFKWTGISRCVRYWSRVSFTVVKLTLSMNLNETSSEGALMLPLIGHAMKFMIHWYIKKEFIIITMIRFQIYVMH